MVPQSRMKSEMVRIQEGARFKIQSDLTHVLQWIHGSQTQKEWNSHQEGKPGEAAVVYQDEEGQENPCVYFATTEEERNANPAQAGQLRFER